MFLDLLRSEAAHNPERMAAVLTGVKAYQEAERIPRPPDMPAAARAGRARLLDYGGSGPAAIFVPSLINPPWILDMAEDNSLLRWLSAQGVRPLLLDWGAPYFGDSILNSEQGYETEPSDPELSILSPKYLTVAGHIETMLLPLIEALGEPAHLIGYCLGGTMAAGAASVRTPLSLTMIAAPWNFDGFPQEARDGLAELWENARPAAEQLGALPMEVLQTAFWKLDPARTVGKFEMFGRLDPQSPKAHAFVTLEDWANDGAPLTFGAGRELIEEMFLGNCTGKVEWRVSGKTVDPAALDCPVLDIVSSTDRIVPEASAARAGEAKTLAHGHVGMVVGGGGREALWEPLAQWLSRVQHK